jgi:hypothetical protein
MPTLNEGPRAPREIEVPAPTAWPFILAFGVMLLFAGLVTSTSVSLLGAALAFAGSIGWFREVFPHEHEVSVPVVPEEIRLTTDRPVVERLPVAADQVRAWLPVHTYPISAGVKGASGIRSICLPRLLIESRYDSDPNSFILFMRAVSRLPFSCMGSSQSWLDYSTARCFPWLPVARLSLGDCLLQCCGRGCSTPSSAW